MSVSNSQLVEELRGKYVSQNTSFEDIIALMTNANFLEDMLKLDEAIHGRPDEDFINFIHDFQNQVGVTEND